MFWEFHSNEFAIICWKRITQATWQHLLFGSRARYKMVWLHGRSSGGRGESGQGGAASTWEDICWWNMAGRASIRGERGTVKVIDVKDILFRKNKLCHAHKAYQIFQLIYKFTRSPSFRSCLAFTSGHRYRALMVNQNTVFEIEINLLRTPKQSNDHKCQSRFVAMPSTRRHCYQKPLWHRFECFATIQSLCSQIFFVVFKYT